RRIQIEAQYVRRFGFEIRVVGSHVPFEPMGLETGAGPRRLHVVVVNLEDARQLPGTPMRTAIRRPLLRLREDTRLERRREHGRLLPLMARPQTVEAVG